MSTPGPYGPSDPPQGDPTEPSQPAYAPQPGYGQGAPGQQPGGYGGYSGYGGYGGPAAPAGPVAPPTSVQRSFQLWLVNIVLGVISAIVGAIVGISATSDILAAGGGAEASAIRAAVVAGAIIFAVFFIVIVGLQLFFAVKMRQGRNWARIVLTVLGVIGILVSLPGLFGASTTRVEGQTIDTSGGPLVTILTVVSILITVAAIVFAFQKPSNDYFSAPAR